MSFDKKKYDQQFVKEKYDRIPINVKKGEKELIAEHAKKKGYNSINQYVNDLIRKDMNESNASISIGEINQSGENNTVNIH